MSTSESESPTLSVCIANYQGSAVISRCLRSVFEQVCGFDVEVIVHDDGSSDSSADMVARDFPDAVLLRSEQNIGFCASNNRMADAATGEYLLLLNNDTRLHPDSLAQLISCAKSDDHTGIWSLPQYDMESGELLDRGMQLDVFANPIPVLNPSEEVATVMGSCLLIKRSLWQRLGGFPGWFGSMAEDMYLCCACRLMGLAVRVTTTGGYDHVVGHSFGGGKVSSNRLNTSFKRRRLSELNKNRVIATCFPAPYHFLAILLQVPLLLAEGCVMSFASRSIRPISEIYWPSIRGILADLPRLRQQRRNNMARRATSSSKFMRPIRLRHHKLSLLLRHGLPRVS